MFLTLYTEDYFNAAHLLNGYKGKCANLHGHTWKVCVWVKGEETKLDPIGLLWDFNKLKQMLQKLDHQYLNEILDFNPTVENLTLHFYRALKKESPYLEFKVRVYESVTKKESYCEIGDF